VDDRLHGDDARVLTGCAGLQDRRDLAPPGPTPTNRWRGVPAGGGLYSLARCVWPLSSEPSAAPASRQAC
jgi:hypothetical protein